MMTLEINVFVALLCFVFLVIVFGLWIRYTLNERDFNITYGESQQCAICMVIFMVKNKKGLYRCPRCQSLGQ